MDIKYAKIDEINGSYEILKGEIKNIKVFYHKLRQNETFVSKYEENMAKVFILAEGEISINKNIMKKRGISAFLPEHEVSITGIKNAAVLEIKVLIDSAQADKTQLPYYLNYEDADKYKENCKSEKTTSRTLLKQRILPNIAIGSVETYGPDEVGCHTHPYIEQMFFAFSENDMELVIDGELFHMSGNALVHIPLASNHGVLIKENQCAHYVWIDYIIDDRALEYLDSTHEDI